LGLYGLIVSVIILGDMDKNNYQFFKAYSHLGAGLCCGLSSLAAGLAIGIVGDAGSLGFSRHQSELAARKTLHWHDAYFDFR